jgi:hypothetical protein
MILHETLADDLIDTLDTNVKALRALFDPLPTPATNRAELLRVVRTEAIAIDLAVLHDLLVAIRDEQAQETADLARAEETTDLAALGGRPPFYNQQTDESWDGRDVM